MSPSKHKYPRQVPASVQNPLTPDPAAATAATPKGAYSPNSSAPANTAPSRKPTPASARPKNARRDTFTVSRRGKHSSFSPARSFVAILSPS